MSSNLYQANAPLPPVETVCEGLVANGVPDEVQAHLDNLNYSLSVIRELDREVQTDMVVARKVHHFFRYDEELQWLNGYYASKALIERAKVVA